jgi:hypothetical protein
MSITEIIRVEHLGPDPDTLLGFSIELPVAAGAKEAYSFEFAGWVLGLRSAAVQIELIANDGPVRRVSIAYPRSDVDRAYPTAPPNAKVGFWAPVSVVGMTPEFELLIQVRLENDDRVPIGRIYGRHKPVPSQFEPTIQPLLVNSLARTGTTWMMRLLSEHPSIAALRIYPYEVRPGKYWMQLLGAMAEPAYRAQSLSKLGNFDSEWWESQDPFQRGSLAQNAALQQWFNSRFVEQTATLCQQSIEDCYREIASVQNQKPPQYFAEKHIPDEVPGIIWELYPHTREIIVVRDFRDMLCSIRAFNAKRGTIGFNRDQVDSEEQYIYRLGREAQQLLSSWRTRSGRACLVRYEDLISQPADTLRRILAYLEIECGSSMVGEILRRAMVDTPEMQAHRTSGSAQKSIARWRSDLDEASKQLCEQVFGEALEEFGYTARQETSMQG